MHWIVYTLSFALYMLVSVHILLTKRDPRGATLWLLIVWLVPIAGSLFYWAFGINRVARKARRRIRHHGRHVPSMPLQGLSLPEVESLDPLRRLGDSLTGHDPYRGNTIAPLYEGTQAYPAMLESIGRAKRSVALSTYIFGHDEIGGRFVEALGKAADRGVMVRVLVDGLGAWGKGRWLRRSLERSGGKVRSFWPTWDLIQQPGLNLRNHRKILVVDGTLGFTGGMNISGKYLPEPGGLPSAHDVHFRVAGPVVRSLVEIFAHDWLLSSGESLHGEGWYPRLRPAGKTLARGLAAGPDEDMGKIYELFLGALRTAGRRVDIVTPYFIPDIAMMTGLRVAQQAGIKVRVLLPRHNDHAFMQWASRAYLPELLDTGIEVWEVGGTFIHSKVMVVDGLWVLVGSSNLDPRSFRLNFEFNVEAYSRPLAGEMERYMARLLKNAHPISHAVLKHESFGVRMRNQAAKLFSPYL